MSEQPLEQPSPNGQPAEEWRVDAKGREFVGARGRSGVVYRQGEETIEQAHSRDALPKKERKPKASAKRVRKPPAPTQVSLIELEHALVEALSAPAFICAMNGDEWGAQHFTTQAPILARNLVKCAEYNPWLKDKLITVMTGEGPLMNVMLFASLAAAAVGYVVPPIVYYLNPPVIPDRAREMVRAKYRIPEPVIVEEPGAAAEAPPFAAPAAAAAI